MPCHHGGTLQDREELLLKLFDMDEMTNILMFLLKPTGNSAIHRHSSCGLELALTVSSSTLNTHSEKETKSSMNT